MNKLKLRPEDLRIETFAITPRSKERGTVLGEQQGTTPGHPTSVSCADTCDATACGDNTCDIGCEATWYGPTCAAATCPTDIVYTCIETCTRSDLPTDCDGLDCS
jgi:hypothetical protein